MIFVTILVGIAVLGMAASYSYLPQYGPAVVNWGNNVKYGGTLNIMMPNGPLQFSLNPYITSNSTLPISFIYESLLYVNMNGDVTHLLGTSYKWEDGDTVLAIPVRQGVKWSDGTPFTVKDVVFTFNYLKKYPTIDLNGVWTGNDLASVTASGNTVLFKFSKPNVAAFQYVVGVPIIPEHIWSKITDPSKDNNHNPVGTGPFLFKSFDQSTNMVTYVKNPNYWMAGRPYVNEVTYSSVNSNNSALLSLMSHKTDISNLYIPNIQKTYVEKDPAANKFWWPALGNNHLIMNDAKFPFNVPAFRKAISMSLNRTKILNLLYFGDITNYDNPTMITYPLRSWLDPTLTSLASSLIAYDPAKAQEILASAGFKKNAQGYLTGPDGKELPTYNLGVVQGWTDWIQGANIMAEELKEIGLRVNVDQQSFGAYYSSLQSGTFDMSITWLTLGITPYYPYYYAFNPSQTAPIGQTASSNFSRYTNPMITAALQVFKTTSDPRLQHQAIDAIQRIVLDDMPIIALLPVPLWDVYQTSTLVGWPDDAHPYYMQGSIQTIPSILALNVHLK